MKNIILDQIRVMDSRFPNKLLSSVGSDIWQEIGNDNSTVIRYKLDFLNVLSLLIKREIEEQASNLPTTTEQNQNYCSMSNTQNGIIVVEVKIMKLKPLKQWICDSCGEIIVESKDGWWEYFTDTKTNLVSGFRIVHYGGPCYYDEQALRRKNKMVGDMHLDHMLTSGSFGHMLHWLELSKTKQIDEDIEITEFTEIMRRLYLPYWEEARQYWEQSFKDGFHDKCGFSENDLRSIINEYSK